MGVRSIIFRAKELHSGRWLYGGLAKDKYGIYVILPEKNWQKGGCVSQNTIGQFTGFKDRNGTDIYEGDILSSEEYPFMNEGKMNYVAIVEWFDYDACWYAAYDLHRNSTAKGISIGCPAEFTEDAVKKYVVIGNIYDNPKIIKGSKQ